MRIIVLIWVLGGMWLQSLAIDQWYPKEGSQLNFTEILFRWPLDPLASHYELQIRQKSDVNAPYINRKTESPDFLLREGLDFGEEYFWEIWTVRKGGKRLWGKGHQFSILKCSKVSPHYWKHKIILNDSSWQENYLFCIDKPGVIINREGKAVWFHSDTNIIRFFDLRVLPNGNIAYLRPKGRRQGNENLLFEERSLDGQLVWQAPDLGIMTEDSVDRYHHDYQILDNGNYLLLGDEYVYLEAPNGAGEVYCRMGILLEFNPQGKLVWSWRSRDHLSLEDIFQRGLQTNPIHLNGFHFEEKSGLLYVSFRYLNRIVEIDKASGEILRNFGSAPPGESALFSGFFHGQHSPLVWQDQLYLYDNGTGKYADTLSAFVRLPLSDTSLTPLRYVLNFGSRRNSWSESKGDVDRISDELFLLGMGSLPRSVVLQNGERMLWVAEHYHRSHLEENWAGTEANYRVDPIPDLWPHRYSLSWKGQGRKGVLVIKNTGHFPGHYEIRIKDKVKKTPLLPVGETYEWPMKEKHVRLLSIGL